MDIEKICLDFYFHFLNLLPIFLTLNIQGGFFKKHPLVYRGANLAIITNLYHVISCSKKQHQYTSTKCTIALIYTKKNYTKIAVLLHAFQSGVALLYTMRYEISQRSCIERLFIIFMIHFFDTTNTQTVSMNTEQCI